MGLYMPLDTPRIPYRPIAVGLPDSFLMHVSMPCETCRIAYRRRPFLESV
jgi:hypothetical protein